MIKVKAFFAYALAALGIPIIMVMLMGSSAWMELFVSATGLKVTPWFTGDEVARQITHGDYRTDIHRPVFQAFIGEHKEGFVQIDWVPLDKLPAQIDETIDYDEDGQDDFQVTFDTQAMQATVTPLNPLVLKLEGTYRTEEAVIIRVRLKNPRLN